MTAQTRTTREQLANPELPPGAEDVASDYYVPPSLRADYRRLTRHEENDRLRNLAPSQAIPAHINGRRRFLEPLRSDADHELFLHIKALELAQRQITNREQHEQQQARNASQYTCAVCERVVPPGIGREGALPRAVLLDGRNVQAKLCLGCWSLVTDRARQRLEASQRDDGRTLGQAADELVAQLVKVAGS